ncbi:MAG: helix-turn-helix transcriptional regulator [Desulfobacteraceae bacterium]
MENNEFRKFRTELGKTQKEMAQLLGVSIKAVHSYEQGWRKIPHHVEKQMLFLLFKRFKNGFNEKCWDILNCPESRRMKCPAWEFDAGELCWFINGTICSAKIHKTWQEKIEECKACSVFPDFFGSRDLN